MAKPKQAPSKNNADARLHEAARRFDERLEAQAKRADRDEVYRELEHKERSHQTEVQGLHDRIAAERDRALLDAVAAVLSLRKTP
jgi:hypothetical protein